MPKRTDAYTVPFEVPELSFDEAVALAADTGRISGDAGPLLETVVDMLDELKRPDEHYDCIQVAGTNGKTSTTRFTAAILRGEGLRAALYTSPQLVRYPRAHGDRRARGRRRRLRPRRVGCRGSGPPRQRGAGGSGGARLHHHALRSADGGSSRGVRRGPD